MANGEYIRGYLWNNGNFHSTSCDRLPKGARAHQPVFWDTGYESRTIRDLISSWEWGGLSTYAFHFLNAGLFSMRLLIVQSSATKNNRCLLGLVCYQIYRRANTSQCEVYSLWPLNYNSCVCVCVTVEGQNCSWRSHLLASLTLTPPQSTPGIRTL